MKNNIVAKLCLVVLSGAVTVASEATTTNTLIATNAAVRALVPSSSAHTNFYTTSYVPSGWLSGTNGVGFGVSYTNAIGLNIQSQAKGVNATFYMRQTFVLAGTSGISNLTLNIKYDDGFVAYLNGTQVAAANNPATPAWNSVATAAHDGSTFASYSINKNLLQAGTNVLAIQGMNQTDNGNDLLIQPELVAVINDVELRVSSTVPATGAQSVPAPAHFIVNFDAAVNTGTVQASDLKVDGLSAAGYTVSDSDTVQFTLPAGLSWGAHTATMDAGAIESTDGGLLVAYTGTYSSVTLPVVTNLPAVDVFPRSATLLASLTDAGADSVTVRFAWGLSNGGTDANAWEHLEDATVAPSGEYYAVPGGLLSETLYYYRAFAVNAAGTNWAPSASSFTTPAVPLPVIHRLWASGISATGAKLNGELAATGGDSPEVHIVWGDNNAGTNNPAAWDHDVNLGIQPELSEFYTVLSGLTNDTIYYFAAYADNSAGRAWKSAVQFSTRSPQPVITEFMASNTNTLTDGFGDYSDWLEIYNPLGTPQDLTGWYLTDTTNNLKKWKFPALSLGSNQYLVVFASSRNTNDPLGYLHTSFSLSAGGEYLALVRPDGITVVSQYTFPAQYPNVSYGLSADGSQIRYFATPTPGAVNSDNYWDKVSDVQFSAERGFYTNAFNVALTSATAGASIRYTRDGSWPSDTNGTLYSSAVSITNTTVLRAIAYKSGLESSPVGAQTYIFLNDVVKQPTNPPGWPSTIVYQHADGGWRTNTSVKWGVYTNKATAQQLQASLTNSLTISLSTDMAMLFETNTSLFGQPQPRVTMDHPVSVEIYDPATGQGTQLTASVRSTGNFFAGYPSLTKIGIRLLFKSEFTDPTTGRTFRGPSKLQYPLFPDTDVDTFNTLVLRGMLQASIINNNGTTIRDSFMHRRFSEMGYAETATHYRYVHVYLNGLYFGVFQAQERPDDAYMASYFGGEPEEYDNLKQGQDSYNDGMPVMTVTPPGTKEAWSNLCTLVPVSESTNGGSTIVVTNTISAENYRIVTNQYLDAERFADYMLLEMVCLNTDWPIKNYYFNCNRGDPAYGPPDLKWMPFTWDGDLAFGTNVTRDYFGLFTATTTNRQEAASPLGRIWNAFYGLPEWKRFFGDRVQKHMFNGGEMSLERLTTAWLAARDEFSPMTAAEHAKWASGTMAGWSNNVNAYITNSWWSTRYSTCLAQLRSHGFLPSIDGPLFTQRGGIVTNGFTVTLTNPNASGTIWYTADNSDPRDSAAKIEYTGPITISVTTRIKACVYDGAEWSALNEATFQVMPVVIVTELMYNPPAGGIYDAQEYEFIELYNPGPGTADLTVMRFANGIEGSLASGGVSNLPAGGYAVIVRNADAFAYRYNSPGILVAGVFSNYLANIGERVELLDKYDLPFLSFRYDDVWYPATDSDGSSLVHYIGNPVSDPNLSSYWEASPDYLGSPGAPDQDLTVPQLLVNEVLTHTDWPQTDAIEIYNPTNTAVDLGGWWLSDGSARLRLFAIPSNTIIPANGYLVIYEDNDGDTSNVPPAAYFGREFSLSSVGEEVYLSSPTLRRIHGFRFGGAANGVSFGRYVTSDGRELFPALQSLTLGATNAGPRTGPLAVTEMMFHPPVGKPEYIELRNISAAPLKLYDESHPSNTWSFTEGISFVFPTGITVQAGRYIVLAETNATAFRAAWNTAADSLVLGPYTGKLDNSGEKLEFSRPDAPNLDGTVPLISVEQISYQPLAPWPEGASGTGSSLERISDTAFGNDPVNWRVSSTNVTPGDYPQVDLDADQLPDNWELKHFGQLNHSLGGPEQDADGDGVSNFREYILGTDPRTAGSDFTGRITVRNSAVEVDFDTIATAGQSGYFGLRRIYEVQQRVPAVTSPWEILPPWTNIPATGSRVTVTNQPVWTSGWYRVRATLE